MVDNLTAEQELKLQEYLEKWRAIGFRTEAMDKGLATDAANFIYDSILEKPRVKLHFVSSPLEAQKLCNTLAQQYFNKPPPSDGKLDYFPPEHGNWFMSYYSFYDYVLHILYPEKLPEFEKFNKFCEHSKNVHLMWTFNENCIICDFPTKINVNEENKLHSNTTPALEYRDGFALHAVDGDVLNKKEWLQKTIMHHSTLGKQVFRAL